MVVALRRAVAAPRCHAASQHNARQPPRAIAPRVVARNARAVQGRGWGGLFQQDRTWVPEAMAQEGELPESEDIEFCVLGPGEEDPCGYHIVHMGHDEVEACNELMHSVSFDTSAADWHLLIDLDSRDVIGIKHGEDLVGVISALHYPTPGGGEGSAGGGAFGWLGNLVVHPGYRAKGLAKLLMRQGVEHLVEARSCERVLLDASAMGKPIYTAMGFCDLSLVHHMSLVDWTRALGWLEAEAAGAGAAESVGGEDALDEVLAKDAEVFGADRGDLLRSWHGRWPEAAVLVRPEGGVGAGVAGYAFVHSRESCDYVGPIAADSPAVAAAALKGALERVRERRGASGGRRGVAVHVMTPLCDDGVGAAADGGEGVAAGRHLGRDWRAELESNGFKCLETTTRQVLLQPEGAPEAVPLACPTAHPGRLGSLVACASLDLG